MITIIGLEKLDKIDSKELTPFQGNLKNLSKENYAKLKRTLETDGFRIPFFVWVNEGKNYLLDGHQRLRVITKEGWHQEYPVIKITAYDIDDAKRTLLKITSQFGDITIEGLDEFMPLWQSLDVSFDKLPNFDLNDANEDPNNSNKEVGVDDLFGDDKTITCPKCKFTFTDK